MLQFLINLSHILIEYAFSWNGSSFSIFIQYISKPIKQLSKLAERMAHLDFNAKYEGVDKGEIGVLGISMNNMSMELESTISQLKTVNKQLPKGY